MLWGEDDLWQICRTYGQSTAHVRMRFIEEITIEMFTPLCQNSKFPDGLIIIILCPHADYIVSSKCHLGPCPIQMTSLDDDPIYGAKRGGMKWNLWRHIGNDGGRVPSNANIYVIGSRCWSWMELWIQFMDNNKWLFSRWLVSYKKLLKFLKFCYLCYLSHHPQLVNNRIL